MASNYKAHVAEAIEAIAPDKMQPSRSLDFGCGDGWYWERFEGEPNFGVITGIDVQERTHPLRQPDFYDGSTLPYEDRSFELAYAIDVLHHCPDPEASLREMARCTDEWLILKDHTWSNPVQFAALSVLDEIGNRKFGIPSRYRYQKKWSWLPILDEAGFEQVALDWPIDANRGAMGRYTKRLNFVGVWRRR